LAPPQAPLHLAPQPYASTGCSKDVSICQPHTVAHSTTKYQLGSAKDQLWVRLLRFGECTFFCNRLGAV
jgi:hypothetical protein